jgi:hypothetical protein
MPLQEPHDIFVSNVSRPTVSSASVTVHPQDCTARAPSRSSSGSVPVNSWVRVSKPRDGDARAAVRAEASDLRCP